jgi:hypothetical protein
MNHSQKAALLALFVSLAIPAFDPAQAQATPACPLMSKADVKKHFPWMDERRPLALAMPPGFATIAANTRRSS